MGEDPWYECSHPKRHLYEERRRWCIAPCKSKKFKLLMLTPREALDRVWPNIDRLWFRSSERIIAVSEAIEQVRAQREPEPQAAVV